MATCVCALTWKGQGAVESPRAELVIDKHTDHAIVRARRNDIEQAIAIEVGGRDVERVIAIGRERRAGVISGRDREIGFEIRAVRGLVPVPPC